MRSFGSPRGQRLLMALAAGWSAVLGALAGYADDASIRAVLVALVGASAGGMALLPGGIKKIPLSVGR
jgi:hypothetical protein